MKQKAVKVIATLLAIAMLYANSAAVISYAADNFLSEQELEKQGTSTKSENVEFDVYYDGGKHTQTIDINKTDTKLNILLNVKNAGYLKNAVVDFSDSEFAITQADTKEYIQSFNAEAKKIEFSQINNGNKVVNSINILADKSEKVSQDMVNRDNKVRLTATYVDAKGKEVAIDKTLVIHTGWNIASENKDSVKAYLDYTVTKYIPYSANGKNKLIIQGKMKSNLENALLPIKQTNIEVTAPQINNTLPESVKVVANSTAATNGDRTGINFNSSNWNYDSATGKITITVENKADANGKISWVKDASDEYLVTYIYSEEVLNAVKDKVVKVNFDANSKLNLYNNNTGVNNPSRKVNGYEEKTTKLGEIADFSASANTSLNKGYMYNNKATADENKKETELTVNYNVNVPYSDIVDSITINEQANKFVLADGNTIDDNAIYNRSIGISKAEFNKILGETGNITVQNVSGEEIATINKDTQETNGMLLVDISSKKLNNVVIKTSKPQIEGNLTIVANKAINANTDYSQEQIKQFSKIKIEAIASVNAEEAKDTKTVEINLEEPTQKTEIATNKETLSTILKNEDVELKVTLENDSIDDVMYSNPTVKINLPTNIENITLKSSQIFFDDELKVKDTNIVDNADGTKTIVVTTNGTQTKYNNAAAKGATLIVKADITLNKLTPTTNTQISAVVTNADKTEVGASTSIQYVAPTGLVTTNSLTGYNGNEEITSISGEEKAVLIAKNAEAKEATFKMNVINNYPNTLENIVVLGRMPFAGNKDIATKQDLGSTMDLTPTSAITTNATNITVYYSENGEATTDLNNSANGWKTNITDYSKVKSYMMVLNNSTMNTGDTFSFSYKANIPANLDADKSAYESYAVFFTNNQASGAISDKAYAAKVGLTTGTAPKLNATLETESTEVQSGSTIKYTLNVENAGSQDANNVTAVIKLPEDVKYIPEEGENQDNYSEEIKVEETTYKELTLKFGKVAPHSKITKNINIRTTATYQKESSIELYATVKSDEGANAETNKITVNLKKTAFTTKVVTKNSNVNHIKNGDTFTYKLEVNSTNIKTDNTIVTINLPQELKYKSMKVGRQETIDNIEDITNSVKINNKKNTITVNIGELNIKNPKILTLEAEVGVLPEGTYQKEVTINANVKADNIPEEQAQEAKALINKAGLKVTQTCNIPAGATLSAGEDLTYTFTIENLSKIYMEDVEFTDYLPQGVQFKSLEIIHSKDDTEYTNKTSEKGNPIANVSLVAEETVTVNLKVSVNILEADKAITNKAKLSHSLMGDITTNEISHTIEKYTPRIDDGDGDDDKPDAETRKVIGTVWIDENKNGIKEAEEQKVSGVTVLLLDNSTGSLAVNSKGEIATTTTNSDGSYMFNNVVKGKYTVIFLYDSANYSPTTYKAKGVDENQNSDAIDKKVEYEGVARIAAVTEEIEVDATNKYNIDLGLVENPKFDLKLDKIVAKITVNNSKGTQTHEYNKNLAKIDFDAKHANSSTMIVEYKFTITNEGAIPGYVKKLADYLPSELKFSTELNQDWYEGKDGTIYNASLANTIINPGESKEVKLILTKNMSKEQMGLISNTAEIYETSNDYGLQDIDSTPGNKATDEDDISTANVLTAIKTGQIIIYSTLIITVIAIIGVGIYLIKKKVIK